MSDTVDRIIKFHLPDVVMDEPDMECLVRVWHDNNVSVDFRSARIRTWMPAGLFVGFDFTELFGVSANMVDGLASTTSPGVFAEDPDDHRAQLEDRGAYDPDGAA